MGSNFSQILSHLSNPHGTYALDLWLEIGRIPTNSPNFCITTLVVF
jgi:hypothetical protein